MKIFEGQYNFQDELDKTLEKNPEENTSDYYADLAKKNAEPIIQRIKDEISVEEVKTEKISPAEEKITRSEETDDRDKPGEEYYGRFNKFRK